MRNNKIIGLLIISLFFFALASCKKVTSIEGPKISSNNEIKDTVYKEYKFADFEQGHLSDSLSVGTYNGEGFSIIKDDTDKYIHYYFSLTNSVCTWDWGQGEFDINAVKFGNTDSIFHLSMNNTNLSNTYLNFNLGGYYNKSTPAMTQVQIITKDSTFSYSINLVWNGWKSISIPFDAFTSPSNTTMKTIGNIKGIHFVLLFQKGAIHPALSMLLDNIVVTQNKVYQFK